MKNVFCVLLFLVTFVASAQDDFQSFPEDALNFVAPKIADTNNIPNNDAGLIVYDTSDNRFKGQKFDGSFTNLSGETLWQIKNSPEYTTTGIKPEMSFYNLTVGKTYRVTLNMACGTNGSPTEVDRSVRVGMVSNGVTIVLTEATIRTTSTYGTIYSASKIFVATNSTLSFYVFDAFNGFVTTNSYVILEELPNHRQVSLW